MSKGRIAHALFLLAMLWPIWAVTDWAVDMQPGKGPQGGEAVMLLAVLAWIVWQAFGIFHAFRLRKRDATRLQRWGVALAPLAAFVLAILWTELEWPAVPGGVLVALLAAGPQLWAVWRP